MYSAYGRTSRRWLRRRVLEAVEAVLEEELAPVLGTSRYERSAERRGYRNGHERRRLTTELGPLTLEVPRARIVEEDGRTREFRSEVVPRYARRTKNVDEAILGAYLAGANTRRIRKALEPLLGTEQLSKSAVSRVAARLKAEFAQWSERDLSEEGYGILFLDGFHLKVRMARRVVIVSDGHRGLAKAIAAWPQARAQRCGVHKWQNLVKHCPAHAHRERKRDSDRIVYAKSGLAAREA